MNIIDATLTRSQLCFGTNPMGWDRLWLGGDKEQAAFFAALTRERREMTEALSIAAGSMQDMDSELKALRKDQAARGVASMGLEGE